MSQQKPSSKKRESSREPWPFSAAASLVNRLAAPASEKATQMRDGYGMKCSASFAKLGPDGYWQKTCGGYYQPVLFSTDGTCSEEYSETWPKMGIVRDGFAMALEMLGRPTRGKESLSWRTPEAGDSANRVFAVNSRGEPKLSAQVKVPAGWWPTPNARDHMGPRRKLTDGQNVSKKGVRWGMDLNQAIQWPAGPGEQHEWEPPRIATGVKDRVNKLKALGNAVVPAQAYPVFRAIMEIEEAIP